MQMISLQSGNSYVVVLVRLVMLLKIGFRLWRIEILGLEFRRLKLVYIGLWLAKIVSTALLPRNLVSGVFRWTDGEMLRCRSSYGEAGGP